MITRRLVISVLTITVLTVGIGGQMPVTSGQTNVVVTGANGQPTTMAVQDPTEYRKKMSEQLRTKLGATEEEWKILEPRIEEVEKLTADVKGPSLMNTGLLPVDTTQTDVAKAAKALRELLKRNATPDELADAIATWRQAKAKATVALEKAQAALRESVNPRQEGLLIQMGLLE